MLLDEGFSLFDASISLVLDGVGDVLRPGSLVLLGDV